MTATRESPMPGRLPGWTFRELNLAGAPGDRCWGNEHYQVVLHVWPPEEARGGMPIAQLSIKRWDREPGIPWRDMQRIKDDICGTECEAVQLYPRGDRLVDTANQYHLWALPAGVVFPLGYTNGRVVDSDPETRAALDAAMAVAQGHPGFVGPKQAPREAHHTDADCNPVGLAGRWWER